jgi:hypothetical protein
MTPTLPLAGRPEKKYKYYAPGIGLIQDGGLKLVKYGVAQKAKD